VTAEHLQPVALPATTEVRRLHPVVMLANEVRTLLEVGQRMPAWQMKTTTAGVVAAQGPTAVRAISVRCCSSEPSSASSDADDARFELGGTAAGTCQGRPAASGQLHLLGPEK